MDKVGLCTGDCSNCDFFPCNEKEQNKINVISAKVISHDIKGKPYYSIEYVLESDGSVNVGYSSFLLDNVHGWLKTCFNIVESGKSKNNSRVSKNEYYLDIAKAVSKRSTCLKRQYGCVIVKDDVIVATGYNGSVRGEENCCDVFDICPRQNTVHNSGDYGSCRSVHAEQNALLSVGREKTLGATMYLFCNDRHWSECNGGYFDWEEINAEPCPLCMRMIKNAGITKIVTKGG